MSFADQLTASRRMILGPDRRLVGPLGLMLVIAIWTIARPYRGVRHDGILYTGQVLHYLWPERLKNDLFFAYGSQDNFSVYSLLVGPLVREFGVAAASMWGLVFCQLFFLFAVWKLAGRFMRPLRWVAVLSVVVFPHTYASLNIFGFAENFLTARSLAEPLALFSLLAWSRHRRVVSLTLLLAAGLVHPLVTLPIAVVIWVMLLREDHRWAALALLALPIVGLGLAGIAPFDGLFRRYDAVWWNQVVDVNKQVLISHWARQDWLSAGTDLLLLWMTSRRGEHRLGELAKSVLWASAGLMAAAFIGADLCRDVLITGLQLWRILWLAHLLALLCLSTVAVAYWKRGWSGRVVAAAAVAALLTVATDIDQSWVLVGWLVAVFLLQKHDKQVSITTWKAAFGATVVAIVVLTVIGVTSTWRRIAGVPELAEVVSPWVGIFSLPMMAVLLGLVLAAVVASRPTWVAAPLILAIGAFGALHWDQRSAWQKNTESSLYVDHPFSAHIPPQAAVYWANGTLEDWVMLKRRQFFGPEQAAGVLFNSGTAARARRLHSVMMPMELQKQLCEVVGGITGNYGDSGEDCAPTADILQAVCHAPDHPDFIVLPTNATPGVVSTWKFTPRPPAESRTLYLYDCTHV